MPIKYKSTRGKQHGLSFEEVVLAGLATDKGLYIPETIPNFSKAEIEKMRPMTFPELAFTVISRFVQADDIPAHTLRQIVHKSYATFRNPDITPTIKLRDFWVLELFHGPTMSFNDIGMQFLGNVLEFFLQRGRVQRSITILGATSGDTGSAAIHGLRGRARIDCFVMFPRGKVTEVQERQMSTIQDENMHCISVEGDYDAAQAIVKAAFADQRFRSEVQLGSVDSNWACLLAQISYYFYSYLRVTDVTDTPESGESGEQRGEPLPISYTVPTGNVGDILAGYYAKRMGLNVARLVICTNENDALHRFLNTGRYEKKPAVPTAALSMDVAVSSDWERYLYHLAGEDGATLRGWMDSFETTGVTVPPPALHQARSDFSSFTADKALIVRTMYSVHREQAYLLSPHTATAAAALSNNSLGPLGLDPLGLGDSIRVVLATAHPAKFEEAGALAVGGAEAPPRPPQLQELFSLQTRKLLLPATLVDVQSYIRSQLYQHKGAYNSDNDDDSDGGRGSGGGGTGTCVAVAIVATTCMLAVRYLHNRGV